MTSKDCSASVASRHFARLGWPRSRSFLADVYKPRRAFSPPLANTGSIGSHFIIATSKSGNLHALVTAQSAAFRGL
jgi:hypothetical protein